MDVMEGLWNDSRRVLGNCRGNRSHTSIRGSSVLFNGLVNVFVMYVIVIVVIVIIIIIVIVAVIIVVTIVVRLNITGSSCF